MSKLKAMPQLIEHKANDKNQAAILFIHGFSGDAVATWGEFPGLLSAEPGLQGWDIWSLGYPTRLRLDLVGLWSADPPLVSLADLLRTHAQDGRLARYQALALVAHSMGGLIVQRALVDDPTFAGGIDQVILFGTPSAGLAKAGLLRRLKRQFRDMDRDGEFIADLRSRWISTFGKRRPFKFLAIAGDQDEFVPRESSIDPFPMEQRSVVPGNHLQIVKPRDATDLSVKIVVKRLLGKAAPAGPWESARLAVESRRFQRAIDLMKARAGELDDPAAIQLAIALDSTGSREEAIQLLENRGRRGTDAMGTLAGRYKRRWIVDHRDVDAEKAMKLYREGYDEAKGQDPAQAFYHGINIAFMELGWHRNRRAAEQWAETSLQHCKVAEAQEGTPDIWRMATEGEASLLLGRTNPALEAYRAAVKAARENWQIDSMYQQANLVVLLVGNKALGERLDAIFRGGT
jgi:pimeloyl-ACP methyl ester carboxylesterase